MEKIPKSAALFSQKTEHIRIYGTTFAKALLEGEARAGGSGHGLDAGHGSADGGGGAGDLVLHLEEAAAHLGQLLSGDLSDLGGGRDGVSGEEPHTGGDGAHDAGFVALH